MPHEVPANCTIETCPHEAVINYLPVLSGNILYLIFFGILLLAHTFMGIRYRTWTFMVGVVLGIFGEMVGYAGRLMMRNDPFNFNTVLISLIPLTLAPALLSASIYLTLSRIITIRGAHHSRLRPPTYTVLFIACDLTALILQSAGGAMASGSESNPDQGKTGLNIMMAGLAFQVASLALFLGLWAEVDWRARRGADKRVESGDAADMFVGIRNTAAFRRFEIALAISTILIFIRSIYRVAELAGGFDSELANNEPLFMVLEGMLIILASGLLAIFHPGPAFGGCWLSAATARRPDSADTLELGGTTRVMV
ncbi:RTA1 like protein-domain-containing protein [Fimicolochytrium jonesii]|uniref:RTA1 like protein-domain-containing protein n=1 Tax=Fimicolochytrium jonesii TaxID=1396493 RepID=UPI0022FEDA9E|nr:RTA1 like protein-domain-containing protein [Fimicolochytrium jonesii]KAI8824440.1 RTA1 like protein-domain-containing protein [Fimicolochytrium jonesii]